MVMQAVQVLAAEGQSKSLLSYIHAGGPISYLLVCISLFAVGVVVANALLLRRQTMIPGHVAEGLGALLRERRLDEVPAFCQQTENDSFLARIVAGALAKVGRSQFGVLEMKPALEEAGARELDRLDRLTHVIGMIAAVGPMLGLLGTVVGMIGAFNTIGTESGVAKNEQLAAYMAVALVTTAEGLIVAIPCTFAYAIFRRRADRLAGEAGDVAETLLSELAGPTTGGAQRAPARANSGAPARQPAGAPS